MIVLGLFAATVIVWSLLEGWLIAHGKPTITARARELDGRYPLAVKLLIFGVGLLLGHLFFT